MTVHPADLLVYAGGACLERYGRLWRVLRPADRGGEEWAPTVTRATAGTVLDRGGLLRSVASGVPRVSWLDLDGDGVRRPCLLVEAARTQVAANPAAPASWTDDGTPVVTTGQTDPFGSAVAVRLEDNDAGQNEGKLTPCTFTGDGTKCVAALVRAGTAAAIEVTLTDATAATNRHRVTVTWNGGTTAPTLATAEGAGTLFTPIPVYDPAGTLWWLIPVGVASVVAANTNNLRVTATTAGTGTFYLAGANAWNAVYPTSWQGASLGTRNADAITLPFYVAPSEDLTVYTVLARPAHADYSGTLGSFPAVWGIAKYGSRPNLGLNFDSPARELQARIVNGSGTASWVEVAVAAGARLTATVQFDASAGAVRSNQGAGWSSWSSSPVGALSAWGASTLYLGDGGETATADYLGGGLYALLVARGHYEPSDFTDWLP